MKKDLSIKEQLKLLPDLPGVYLMHDTEGNIIYIGKAKNLKNRVRSYFSRKQHDAPKLRVMVPQIIRFEFIITDSEIEALILESHLIKRHKPKYNVLLKDDKKFPWFLVTQEPYPRIIVTRKNKLNEEKGKYFGPYTDARAMYSTLELIKKLFPLKQCKNPRFKDRPCMYHQIGKCLGPCQKLVSSDDYKAVVKQVELFLSGRQTELVQELKKQMELHSEKQEFEKAARYRDSYFDVMKVVEKQKIVTENTNVNQDIIGYEKDSLRMSVALLKIRDGRLIGKEDFDFKLEDFDTVEETLLSFIKEYYTMIGNGHDLPKEILLPEEVDTQEKKLIKDWLSYKKGSKVDILLPKAQKKHELVELANKNAFMNFEKIKVMDLAEIQTEWNDIGSYIKEKLELTKFPHIIECFDISHIQGTNTVASMVVFKNGKPLKSEYKRFKIRSTEGKPNDFESMQEVIRRRYTKVLKNDLPLADLIIVDGGKGQLSVAKEILDELGLVNQSIVSLAKKLEEVFIPEKKKPIIFPVNSQALYLFQKIRDEAHRFAITYHRKLRDSQALRSILDEIPGIGAQKKKILFEHFDDMKGIMHAKRVELEKVLGKRTGMALYKHLHQQNR